ncbi:MAG: hypothetical protein R3F46_08650 [bacterium]
MPSLICILLGLLMLAGCNKPDSANEGDAGQQTASEASEAETEPEIPPVPLERRRVLAAFSGSETDPWTADMLGALGSALHFDAWSSADADEYFDYYGTYDVTHGNQPLDLRIVLTGMDSINGVERQQAAAAHLLEQAQEFEADLVWLDGDPLQFHAGRLLLDNGFQIVFSGLTYDSSLYYEAEDNAAGFYRRHSVSGTMGRIWRDDDKALFHCIITDDSPEGRRRLREFTDAEDLMGEGSTLHVLPVFTSWVELSEAIEELPPDADDLIICAAGEAGASEDLATDPASDLLSFSPVPVYVLGPSPLDMLGCTSLLIRPAAQVSEILTVFEANLSREIPMSNIPTIVPEDMQVQLSEPADVMPRDSTGD